jgi:[protein-PII] uridylyltransferase
VAIDNQTSRVATVIEASGRDRPGLLQALARVLADTGLSIQSAHIDGHGERAVDSFYVVEPHGAKLSDAARISALRTKLIEVLDSDPAAAPRRLPTARASRAR